MPDDLSSLSDDEVLRLAGVERPAMPDFSQASDEEVLRAAGISAPAATPVAMGPATPATPGSSVARAASSRHPNLVLPEDPIAATLAEESETTHPTDALASGPWAAEELPRRVAVNVARTDERERALAAEEAGRQREHDAVAEWDRQQLKKAYDAAYGDDPIYRSSGLTPVQRTEMARAQEESAERQAREGWFNHPVGQIVEAFGAPVTAPFRATADLIEQQQPGKPLHDVSMGKRLLEAGTRGLGAGIQTASILTPGTVKGAAVMAAGAPVINPVMQAIDVGPAIERATGSQGLGELGSMAEQFALMYGGQRAGSAAARKLNPFKRAPAFPEIPTGRGTVTPALDFAASAPVEPQFTRPPRVMARRAGPGRAVSEKAAPEPRGVPSDPVSTPGQGAALPERAAPAPEGGPPAAPGRTTAGEGAAPIEAPAPVEGVPPASGPPAAAGASRSARLGGRGTSRESGALRIPTAREAADAVAKVQDPIEAKGGAAWRKVAQPLADAVSRIADKVPFVQRIRQWGVHEALKVDPSETLFQAHEKRLGKIEYGQRQAEQSARQIDKALKGVGANDRAEVYRYMAGERPALPQSAAGAQGVIDAAVAEMHRTRAEMLQRKQISPEVFAEYPRFVSRILRVMETEKGGRTIGRGSNLPKLLDEVYRQDAHGVIVNAPKVEMDVVAGPHKPRVVTGSERQTLLKFETPEAREAFMQDLAAWESAKRGRLTGPKGAEPLVAERFEPLPLDVRQALGEVMEPGDSFAMTLARSKAKIATHDLLASIEGLGKGQQSGDWVLPNGVGPSLKGYTQVSGRGWGALDGKWLRNDVHEYASGLVAPETTNALARGLKAAFGQWKFDRTVGSWPTVVRNYLASHYMSVEAGVNYANPRNWPAWQKSIATLIGKDPATLKWAIENRIVGADFYSKEFRARVERALHGSDNPLAAIFEAAKASKDPTMSEAGKTRLMGRAAEAAGEVAVNPATVIPGAQKVKRVAGEVYRFENDSRRLAAALKLREKGLPMDQLLRELDATTENYGRGGGLQTTLQNTPVIGPFARFTWERYRIAKNNLINHPVRLAETLAYGYVAKKALEIALGRDVTDEERKAVQREYGWQTAALDPDESGKVRTLDTRYLVPFGQVMAGPEMDRRVGEESQAVLDYIARALGGGQSPVIEPLTALTTGRDSRGKSVADPFTRHRLGAAGTGVEVWRQFVGPPIIGNQADKAVAASKGVALSPRRPVQSMGDVVLSYLAGVSLGYLDYETARRNLELQWQSRSREVIGAGRKRIREGEKRKDLRAEGHEILDPVEDQLKERRSILKAAQKSRPTERDQ